MGQEFCIKANDGIHKKGIEIFNNHGIKVSTNKLDQSELLKELKAFHGIIVRSATKVTSEVIQAGYDNGKGKLRVIGRAGKGLNNIDIPTATELGIPVIPAPEGNNNATAEFTIGLLFDVARGISAANVALNKGEWQKKRFKGVELKGKTLGIIGCGQVGMEVAEKAAALGMRVIGYDLAAKKISTVISYKASLGEVLHEAHFITIHTGGKTLILGEEQIAEMRNGACIINTSRGENVNADALRAALESGKLTAVAVDTHLNEPQTDCTGFSSPLQNVRGATLTPHIAGSTREADEAVSVEIAKLICDCLVRGDITRAVNMGPEAAEVKRETYTVQITHRDDKAVFKDFDSLFGEAGISIKETRSGPMASKKGIATTVYILYAVPSEEVLDRIRALESVSHVIY